MDPTILENVNNLLVQEIVSARWIAVEQLFTCIFHMVICIQAESMVLVTKLLRVYLNWDKDKPSGGIVMCKAISNKGLHTFHV